MTRPAARHRAAARVGSLSGARRSVARSRDSRAVSRPGCLAATRWSRPLRSSRHRRRAGRRRSARRCWRRARPARFGVPWHSVAGAEASRHKVRAARAISAMPGCPCRGSRSSSRARIRAHSTSPFPCVVKPVVLAASRGVIRADNERELEAAVERVRRMLDAPDVRAMRDPDAGTVLIEGFISGPGVRRRGRARSRHAARAGDLRQARSAGRSVLRRDDLRDAVARARRRSVGDARRGVGRVPRARPGARARPCRVPRRRRSRTCPGSRGAADRRSVRRRIAVHAARRRAHLARGAAAAPRRRGFRGSRGRARRQPPA